MLLPPPLQDEKAKLLKDRLKKYCQKVGLARGFSGGSRVCQALTRAHSTKDKLKRYCQKVGSVRPAPSVHAWPGLAAAKGGHKDK